MEITRLRTPLGPPPLKDILIQGFARGSTRSSCGLLAFYLLLGYLRMRSLKRDATEESIEGMHACR